MNLEEYFKKKATRTLKELERDLGKEGVREAIYSLNVGIVKEGDRINFHYFDIDNIDKEMLEVIMKTRSELDLDDFPPIVLVKKRSFGKMSVYDVKTVDEVEELAEYIK